MRHEDVVDLIWRGIADKATPLRWTDVLRIIGEHVGEQTDPLKQALKFYARKSNYASATVYMCGHGGQTQVDVDGGNKARAALETNEKLDA